MEPVHSFGQFIQGQYTPDPLGDTTAIGEVQPQELWEIPVDDKSDKLRHLKTAAWALALAIVIWSNVNDIISSDSATPSKPQPVAFDPGYWDLNGAHDEIIYWVEENGYGWRTSEDLKGITRLHMSLEPAGEELKDLTPFIMFGNLEDLQIEGYTLPDLTPLESLKKLKYLTLFDIPNLTQAKLEKLQKALPNCRISDKR